MLDRFRHIREATSRLAAPLTPEDCQAQSMAEASPIKWQLGHTTWFFETFVLEARQGFTPFEPVFREIFNSYYNAVGEQHPRDKRGLLTRPPLDRVMEYRAAVDEAVASLCDAGLSARDAGLVELGTHHEQQHQELMLTDLKHLLFQNPVFHRYRDDLKIAPASVASPLEWIAYPGGQVAIGHQGEGFAFDNEGPRHRVFLEPFEIASRLVTNLEYLDFITDDGYRRAEFWLADAWAWLQREGTSTPLYWQMREGAWMEFTLGGWRPLNLDAPVGHLSFYEANAYANWKGCRLPTESEWEHAAADCSPAQGNFMESDFLHPTPAPHGSGLTQMFGDLWEWTQSAYAPYPGFKTPEGAVGEYNGKFMANQLVLRGGSCATSRSHIRSTYRNFFYPEAQWQFSGIRLLRD